MGWLCMEENTPFAMKRGQKKKTLRIVSGGRRKNLISCKLQCPIWMGLHTAVKRWETRLSAARGPLPDLTCTRPTEGSSCWVSCHMVFPTHLSRSSQTLPVNTQTVRLEAEANISSADDFTSPTTPAELCLHSLGWGSPGKLAPATAELPASHLVQVLILVSTSERPQRIRFGTNSPQKARRDFCWLKGLGKGCVGPRANMGREAESTIPLPTITSGPSRHSLLNYIHTTQ